MISLRKCVGCGARKVKEDLIRVVKVAGSSAGAKIIIANGHAEGRGVYLCKSEKCLQKAEKGRRLERAFSCKVDSDIYNKLESMVKNSEQ